MKVYPLCFDPALQRKIEKDDWVILIFFQPHLASPNSLEQLKLQKGK